MTFGLDSVDFTTVYDQELIEKRTENNIFIFKESIRVSLFFHFKKYFKQNLGMGMDLSSITFLLKNIKARIQG